MHIAPKYNQATAFLYILWKIILYCNASNDIPTTRQIIVQIHSLYPKILGISKLKPYPTAETRAIIKSSVVNNFFMLYTLLLRCLNVTDIGKNVPPLTIATFAKGFLSSMVMILPRISVCFITEFSFVCFIWSSTQVAHD